MTRFGISYGGVREEVGGVGRKASARPVLYIFSLQAVGFLLDLVRGTWPGLARGWMFMAAA